MPDNPQNPPTDTGEAAVPVYRYAPREVGWQPSEGHGEDIEKIEAHIHRYIGPVENVFHEIASDIVHIDVHFIPPSPGRNYHTLVTTGMSDRPMRTPEGAEEFAYAELMVNLPAHWPLSEAAFRDERHYWPILWLKRLARFPHEYNTWLFHGHTVPNGDPAQGFDPDTELCCWLLWDPDVTEEGAETARVSEEKEVYFLQLMPLYREEVEAKLRGGNDELLKVLSGSGLTREQLYVIDRKRPNAAPRKRGFWPFRR